MGEFKWPDDRICAAVPIGNGINPPSIGLEVFTAEFEGSFTRGGLFNMTMHPSLTGRPSALIVLERLNHQFRGFPRVWWVKLREIADYCHLGSVAPALPRATTEFPQQNGWIEHGEALRRQDSTRRLSGGAGRRISYRLCHCSDLI